MSYDNSESRVEALDKLALALYHAYKASDSGSLSCNSCATVIDAIVNEVKIIKQSQDWRLPKENPKDSS